MPHVPDRHTDHDLALVAASATDDLTDAERVTVTELLARCRDCTQLQADLRSLAAATAALPVAPRRRDYRITAEQAARLRPSGIRGILSTFASRRFAFAAPVGTAMATLGLVGLLVAAVPGPLAGGVALRTTDEGGAGGAQLQAAPEGFDTQAAPSAELVVPYAEPAPADGAVVGTGGNDGPVTTIANELGQARGPDAVLVILGGTALLVGTALLALRWLGRRLA